MKRFLAERPVVPLRCRGYSARSTAAGRSRAAVRPGKAAMTFASSSVTGMVSSSSSTPKVARLATPAVPAKMAQARRPAMTPSGIPASSEAAASALAS
jgi:hypothetical protein